jgi:hypothetical protein
MRIIPSEIMSMTAVLAGRCLYCGGWAGTIVKQYSSPAEALMDQEWPDLTCTPVICCEHEVWPTHFLVIYQGEIVQQKDIGGPDLEVRYKFE